MQFVYNDGGRTKKRTKKTGDCVVRAIAIATGKDYDDVADEVVRRANSARRNSRKSRSCPEKGVFRALYEPMLADWGWKWVAVSGIGTGCKMHMRADELPDAVIICRVSKHLACVKHGVLHDTYDCSRGGTRCVYGYFIKED